MRRILLLVALLLWAAPVSAATYYVAKTGNDANNCTNAMSQSTPKLTINSGLGCLSAGDELLIKEGTYAESIIDPAIAGTNWSNKVRIAHYMSDVVWLDPGAGGSGYAQYYVIYFGNAQKYVEFDGININGGASSTRSGRINFTSTVATTNDPHHIRVKNAEILMSGDGVASQFTASGDIGVGVFSIIDAPVGGFEFQNLTIHGTHDAGDLSTAFYINTGDTVIEDCNVYGQYGEGIQVYSAHPGGGTPDGTIIRRNRVHDITVQVTNEIFGILTSANGVAVYNNLIYGNGGSGIKVFGAASVGTLLYNNTLYGNTKGIQVDAAATGTIVRNNLAYLNTTNYNNDAGGSTTHTSNLEGTNPGFTNAGAADFTIGSGSAAKDTGATLASVTTDFIGTARPQNSLYDIGAYEFAVEAMDPYITPATGTVVVTANFTDTPGDNIVGAYTAETGGPFVEHVAAGGNMVISDVDRARLGEAATVSIDYATGQSSTNEYDVKSTVRVITLAGDEYHLWGRLATSASVTGILAYYSIAASAFYLVSYVDDAYTQLDTYPMVLSTSTNYVWRLKLRADSVSFDVDDMQIMYAANMSVLAKGYAAIGGYTTAAPNNATGLHWGDFIVTDLFTTGVPTGNLTWRLRFVR